MGIFFCFFCFFRFGDSSFFYDHGVFGTKLVWREVFERTTLRPCVPLALDDCIQITGSGKITFKVRVSWDPLLPCSPSKAADFTHLSPLPPCSVDCLSHAAGLCSLPFPIRSCFSLPPGCLQPPLVPHSPQHVSFMGKKKMLLGYVDAFQWKLSPQSRSCAQGQCPFGGALHLWIRPRLLWIHACFLAKCTIICFLSARDRVRPYVEMMSAA